MNYIKPNWPAPAHVKAYTTLRNVWDDHPNDKIKSLLSLPSDPLWITQKHTNIVVEATVENQHKIADASFSVHPNHVCVVLTADCLPVLICNKQGTHVAAIHAGWRGLASGVIEATIDALQQPADDLLVWLGPAIGPTKFEVGKDVYDAFVTQDVSSAIAFTPLNEQKWLANLYTLAKMRLAKKGVSAIFSDDYCTHTQDDLFFSYRRDKGQTGRMASLIWINR